MRNSLTLPVVSLVVAALLAVAAMLSFFVRDEERGFVLSELEVGMLGWAILLVMFGVQGIISVISEGRELQPGKAPPRLTDPLTGGIVTLSIFLAGSAVLLAFSIIGNLSVGVLGTVAGFGCIVLALLLPFYKEAFLGDEARLDERDDGIPW